MKYFIWDDVFTCMDGDAALEYLNSYGLFGDSVMGLKKALMENDIKELITVLDQENDKRFVAGSIVPGSTSSCYLFFIPLNRIKETSN